MTIIKTVKAKGKEQKIVYIPRNSHIKVGDKVLIIKVEFT